MQKLITILLISTICIAFIGCSGAAKIVRQKTINERSDIFTEIGKSGVIEKGYAILKIKASIKTHLEDYYLYESASTMHGKPAYPFVINIDGQAVTWNVDGQKEVLPFNDKKGETSHDPEAGEGIRYTLVKKIQLRPGLHKVFFVLPAENYFREVNITLHENKEAALELKPVYKYKNQPHRIPDFKKGIKKYEAYLNNILVKDDDH